MGKELKICFVCSGNTCRSIMAERLMKKEIKNKGISSVRINSRGLYARGENISKNAKIVLKECKACSADRKSVQLKKIDVETLYIVMTDKMKKQINGKVLSAKDFIGRDILDPYMRDLDCYRETASEIRYLIDKIIDKIIKVRGEV